MSAENTPVLILNYGGWDDTMALVSRLGNESANMWVIDNGSPVDRSAELVSRFPHVHYLPLKNNWGWSGGYNRAIEHVRRTQALEHVYILNNDAIPEPGAIAHTVRHFKAHPRLAAVGSVMLTSDGERVLFDGKFREPPLVAAEVGRDLIAAERIHGGGFALSLTAYDAIGPFHEPYFLYHEESEWCLRARAAGWTFLVDGASRMRHDGCGSDVNENREYYLTRNRYLALSRGFPLEKHETSVGALIDWDFRDMTWRPHLRDTIFQGMVDGVAGRFGRRAPHGLSWEQRLFARFQLTSRRHLFRVRRKLGSLQGH